jgi:hypothetical protein
MANEQIDPEAVLADLIAKRDALDGAIAAIRAAYGLAQPAPQGGSPVGRPIDPSSIPDDAFFGLSIGEAAKKYLGIMKRKQSIREIAEALDNGGLPHSSTNFFNTVATMLNRAAKGDPELVRVGRGEWGLAGWYGNRRPKPEPPRKQKRSKRGKKPLALSAGSAESE